MVRRTSAPTMISMPVVFLVSPVAPAEITVDTAITTDMAVADISAMMTTERDHHTTEELEATPTPSDTTEVLSHPKPAVATVLTSATPDKDLLMMSAHTDVPADTDPVSESSKVSVEAEVSRVSTLSPATAATKAMATASSRDMVAMVATVRSSAMVVTATDNSLTADPAMADSLLVTDRPLSVTDRDLSAAVRSAMEVTARDNSLMAATANSLTASTVNRTAMAVTARDSSLTADTVLATDPRDTEASKLLSQLMPSLSSTRDSTSPRDSQTDMMTILRVKLEDTDTDFPLMDTMMATDHPTSAVEDVTRTSTSLENPNSSDTVSSALTPDVKTLTSTPTRNPLTTVTRTVITRIRSTVRRISAPTTISMPVVSLASLVAPVKITVATAIATVMAIRPSLPTEDTEINR